MTTNVWDITWARTYGGPHDEIACSAQQTHDGGYIVAGKSYSAVVDAEGRVWYWEAWLLKLDSLGNIQWQKTYGVEGGIDWATSVQQTSDGGYIVAGATPGFGDVWSNFWLLKLDASGNVEWQKTYGGSSPDVANSIRQTSDGGYIVAGYTFSFGAGDRDFWLLKLDASGDIQWQKAYGGESYDEAFSVRQTSEGGYIVAGETTSFGEGNNFWLLKLDTSGNIQWQKVYRGAGGARSVEQTSDRGYIVAGWNTGLYGDRDFRLLKLDASGIVQWQKIYGRGGWDVPASVWQTSDGGYIVAGATDSFGAGNNDFWVLKLNPLGDVQWEKTYGGTRHDEASVVQQTLDGGYIVVGQTASFGAGERDFWLIKTNEQGSVCLYPGIGAPSNASVREMTTPVSDTSATVTNTSAVVQDTSCRIYHISTTVTTQCEPMLDSDGDSVPDIEEQGPAGDDPSYDGNSDGIPDHEQRDVASLHTYDGSAYVTLACSGGTFQDVQAQDNPHPSDSPEGVEFPWGFFSFTIELDPGVTEATVTIYLPAGSSPTTYWKYGLTPDNATDHWYEFLYDGQTGAQFSGDIITLHLADGQRGDHGLAANGVIHDPGGPGFPSVLPGDVNLDGAVDAQDLALVATAFGSMLGMPNWNRAADLNTDGVVDIFDLVLVGRNFGG